MDDPRVVLVVDDDPDARAVLAHDIHASAGATVVQAASVGEACRLMRTARPALIISDVIMPGGGGRAVAAEAAHVGVPCRLVSSMPAVSRHMAAAVTPKADAAGLAALWLKPTPRADAGRPQAWWRLDAHAMALALAFLALA